MFLVTDNWCKRKVNTKHLRLQNKEKITKLKSLFIQQSSCNSDTKTKQNGGEQQKLLFYCRHFVCAANNQSSREAFPRCPAGHR